MDITTNHQKQEEAPTTGSQQPAVGAYPWEGGFTGEIQLYQLRGV